MALIKKSDFPFLAYSVATLGLRVLPLSLRLQWCKGAAKKLGLIWYRLDRSKAVLARQNLQAVLGQRLSAAEIEAAAQAHFQNIALSKLISDLLPMLTLPELNQFLSFEGEDRLTNVLKEGKGCILLGAHLGLHGYVPLTLLKRLEYQFVAVVGAEVGPDNSWVYHHIIHPIRSRNWHQIPIVNPNGTPQRDMVKCLQQNQILAIWGEFLNNKELLRLSPPQVVPVPFFEHTILLKTGPFRLARWLKSPVVPFFILPRSDGGFRMVIDTPLPLSDDQSTAGLVADLAAFMARLEPHILRHPELWAFWRIEFLLDLIRPVGKEPVSEAAHSGLAAVETHLELPRSQR